MGGSILEISNASNCSFGLNLLKNIHRKMNQLLQKFHSKRTIRETQRNDNP